MRSQSLFFLALLGSTASTGTESASAPMQSLNYFIGQWNCAGTFATNGKAIASHVRYAGDLQGAALLKHHDDTSPPMLYHAIEAWGYDAKAQRFNATVLDNFGGARRFSSDGWKQDELIWTSAAEVEPAQRFVYDRLDQGHYRIQWQVARKDAGFAVGDTLQCSRG